MSKLRIHVGNWASHELSFVLEFGLSSRLVFPPFNFVPGNTLPITPSIEAAAPVRRVHCRCQSCAVQLRALT